MSLKRSSQLLVAAAALVLSGCGAPAGFVLVSLAIDGAALVATGKTPGEHALSAIMKQDCAVRNLMANGDLCEDVTVTADVAVLRWAIVGSESASLSNTKGRSGVEPSSKDHASPSSATFALAICSSGL